MFPVFDEGDSQYPKLGQGFLDCGAYSVLTGIWDELPLDDYDTFVMEQHEAFALIAAPDVIGDPVATFENLKRFVFMADGLQHWNLIKDRVMVTYHLGDRDLLLCDEMLDWAWEQGIRWLAVGGIVVPGTKLGQRALAIDEVMKLAYSKHPWKVHLFGGHQPELIKLFRPDSVDSSAYIAGAKVLDIIGYKGWDRFIYKVSKTDEEHQLKQLAARLAEIEYPHGDDIVQALKEMPDGVRLWLVNVLNVKHFEDWVRKEIGKPEFRYWVTIAPGMPQSVMRYSELIQEQFWTGWRDRCLVAYPSFWAGHGQQHKDLIVVEEMLRDG